MKTKKIDTTPFDRHREPPKQNLLAMLYFWVYCWFLTRQGKLKITKVGMKGLKPPYLVLGTHLSFMDFCVTPLALFPRRANYVSELEGFEAYGEWAYRHIGCLGTRKFVNDLALVKNIKRVIERKGILVLYPEARYANVGTSSKLPDSMAKLVKMLDVPVVVIDMKGNYLQSPIWNLSIRKQARLETTLSLLLTKEEVSALPATAIQQKIQEALTYDEYAWQAKNRMSITYEKRAEGLELVLYQCPCCAKLFRMTSTGAKISCQDCGSGWTMTEFGKLERAKTPSEIPGSALDFTHIPDWYEWQRSRVVEEIESGAYALRMRVRIESLPNAVNFIDLGEGTLVHDRSGFSLTFVEYGESEEQTLQFPSISMTSIHTETNYRKKGQCVTLSTLDNTYFLFPLEEGFNAVKILFATEHLYERAMAKNHRSPL